MKTLLRDTRVQRLLLANITGSVGSGVTIIAVPWLLIHRAGGDRLYGLATIGTTLALFLFMPFYGAWIDRHSRKTMLLAGELFGFAATLTMALWMLAGGRVAVWQLMTCYFCGMLYYTLHFSAKFAFLQQIFDRGQYQSLMGLMEIQGQTASMLAGGLAGMLVDRVALSTLLFIDASTYLFSFFVQSTLPYAATHLDASARPPAGTRKAMDEGWRWLRARPRLSVFFACTLVPFICVMVGNYLFPLYVANVLRASAHVFGVGEITFAIGAMLAGVVIARLVKPESADRIMIAMMSVCIVSLGLLAALPSNTGYCVALLAFGLGNAGTRVARSSTLLHLVPNPVMGRVGMFYNAYDRLLRTLLIGLMTWLVPHIGAALGLGLLGLVTGAALLGALASRDSLKAHLAEAVL